MMEPHPATLPAVLSTSARAQLSGLAASTSLPPFFSFTDPAVVVRWCFFFQAEDGIRDHCVTGVQTCALPISGLVDLRNPSAFYYVVLALLLLFLVLGRRLVDARFGMVIRSARSNEPRARAIGFAPFRYKLAAFVLAGGACGLAGALLANQTEYLTPDFMHWTRSGEIMFMVILGGMRTLFGPVLGAVVLLGLEDVLSALTEHWQIILGPFLVVVVLFAKRGLFGLVSRDG